MAGEDWGSIVFGVRRSKVVEGKFFDDWSHLLWRMATDLGRPGDGFLIAGDRPAHVAANDLCRRFLKTGNDTLLLIDDDGSFGPEIIEEMREFRPGWEFDCLQAFYTRRGWPPEAIWFTRDALGNLAQNWVLREWTTEVATVGTHFLMIRRHVLERMRAARDPEIEEDDYEWFFYPRHIRRSEDTAFSLEAGQIARLGATTGVKVGHISKVVTGWQTYQQFLEISGQKERLLRMEKNVQLVSAYLGEKPEMVRAKANQGSANVQEGLEAYLFGESEDGLMQLGDLSAKQARDFYGVQGSGYLYELILWNSSVLYDQVLDLLRSFERKSVLVVGGGIGGEVDALWPRNAVIVFELPGAMREFLLWRYREAEPNDRVQIYTEPADLREIAPPPEEFKYDVVVAIDTVEHFHPNDFEETLDQMLELTKEGGYLFFRNNFGQLDKYPMHFDHSEAWAEWIAKHDLELDAEYAGIGVEVYRKGVTEHGESTGEGELLEQVRG